MKNCFFLFVLFLLSFTCVSCDHDIRSGCEAFLYDFKNPDKEIICYSDATCTTPVCKVEHGTQLRKARFAKKMGWFGINMKNTSVVEILLYDQPTTMFVKSRYVYIKESKYEFSGEKQITYYFNSDYKEIPIYSDLKCKNKSFTYYQLVRFTNEFGSEYRIVSNTPTYVSKVSKNVYKISIFGHEGYVPSKYFKSHPIEFRKPIVITSESSLSPIGITWVTKMANKYDTFLQSDFARWISHQYNLIYGFIAIFLIMYLLNASPFSDRVSAVLVSFLAVLAITFFFFHFYVSSNTLYPYRSPYLDFVEWMQGNNVSHDTEGILLLVIIVTIFLGGTLGYVIFMSEGISECLMALIIQTVTPVYLFSFLAPGGKTLTAREILSLISMLLVYAAVLCTAHYYLPLKMSADTCQLIIQSATYISIILSIICVVLGLIEKKWLSFLYILQPILAAFTALVIYKFFSFFLSVVVITIGIYVLSQMLFAIGASSSSESDVEENPYSYDTTMQDNNGNTLYGTVEGEIFRDTHTGETYRRDSFGRYYNENGDTSDFLNPRS